MVMSPMDEISWFQTPLESALALPVTPTIGNLGTLIVKADAQRVGIIFSVSAQAGNGFALVSTVQKSAGFSGLVLNQNATPLQLYQKDCGSLVQQAWYGFANGTVTLTVIEIRLRDWPKAQE